MNKNKEALEKIHRKNYFVINKKGICEYFFFKRFDTHKS